jgi:short-subunit dehydrogenase involved in D-alanine esterification of teichoic acids
MKKYYTNEDVEKGITVDGVEVIPPITSTTLRNARAKRQLKYCKISRECRYTLEWLQAYINRTVVEAKTA